MRSWLLSTVGLFVLGVAAAACGGGGDDSGETPSAGTATAARTSVAGSPAAQASAGASAAPGSARTSPAGTGTVVPATAAPARTGTPQPVTSATSGEATTAAELGEDIAGGDPAAPRRPVSTIPAPPPGSSPVVDSTEVAPPAVDDPGLKLIVDLDAAAFGVQSTRTVKVGDVFRVAIVVANVPDGEGLASFNFFLDYDRAKIVAPSYANGPATDRNPDLHEASLGAGWSCIPAPEGDVDDPGGIDGDGNPVTGRALISCFNVGGSATGTVVLATIEFYAVEAGSTGVILSEVGTYRGDFAAVAKCEGDEGDGPVVPCEAGTVTVE